MSSDLEIFMDMMDDLEGGSRFVEVVEPGKDNSYYQGLGIHILKQFENNDHYFHFLKSILKNYNELEQNQKDEIYELLNIQPKIIIKEKIVYKGGKKKNTKPKLNNFDDY
jgi:hypothetical protein